MSTFFTIQQAEPVIRSPISIIAKNNKTIIISGEQFKRNILQISGQNVLNPNQDFLINGINKQDISGINNTLTEDVVGFSISGIAPSIYNVSVFNDYGKSTNNFKLTVLDTPKISGFDSLNVLPGQYVRVSGEYLNPGGNIFFTNNFGAKIYPSFIDSGFYRITGYSINQNGTGYNINETFIVNGIKNYDSNSSAILTIDTTGLSGSLGSFSITNSGIFTVPNLNRNIEVITNSPTGKNALVDIFYEKYENTGKIQFLEFNIPFNLSKNQSGYLENLEYPGFNGAFFQDIYISGYPNIYGFSPNTGLIDSTIVDITGDNLIFVDSLKIGSFNISNFTTIDQGRIRFTIPNYSASDYLYVSGKYGGSKSSSILSVFYPPIIASGFNPNDILAGTGALITISGKYLQRINYINLGSPNVLRKDINVNSNGNIATFPLPNNYTTTKLNIFSVDFPNSGTLIQSASTNDLLISTVRLSIDNINIRYLSGIQAAKYLDDIEIYSPSGLSGDYGNLINSDVYFLGITGSLDQPKDYLISGIKIDNTPTGIKFKLPREIRNPQARIKIKRNRFQDEYILPSNKSIDILPTIQDCTNSNTLYNSLGYIKISGINASNVNLIYFSGYSGTKTILGEKDVVNFPLEIVSKDSYSITGVSGDNNGYTVFEAKLGGNITGSGEIFLFNNYYDTGIGYENNIITTGKNIRVTSISGYRPPNSDIFTSPGYISTPLEQPFFYTITTNSRATRFEITPSTISGIGGEEWPTGIEPYLNRANQIFGVPQIGGIFYLKIKALDGERPNEGMILNLAVGSSGRSLSGPGITYRGPWKYEIGYVGGSLRRDVVKYNRDGVQYWYAAYTNINSEPQAGNSNWIPFTNEFAATATQVLLAEESNITNSLNIGEQGVPSGFIKTVNDKNVDEGSGFYLGYDNRYNINKPKFRVGNQDNYIKFDGNGLDIIGPLSGVITTSKDIINANNKVNSNSSVAIGINNIITHNNDNVFIFGTDNYITGSRRSNIAAGKNNIISSEKSFFTDNSTIAGGESNKLIGSYCSILGGYANSVNAASTGLSSFANQMFIKEISGTLSIIDYESEIFTDELAILTEVESNDSTYKVERVYDINTLNYTIDLYPPLEKPIKVNTWLSLLSSNLYSGSFIPSDSNRICEFKVDRTGILSGDRTYWVNFKTKFVNNTGYNDLIILTNPIGLQGNYRLASVSGLTSSGYYITFPSILTEDLNLHYFIGNTGYFTGSNFNFGKSLEINKNLPFKNLISGIDGKYTVPLIRKGINFNGIIHNPYNESFYLNVHSGNVSNDLNLIISSNINDQEEYLKVLSIGFTGRILNNNFQIYQTGLSSGSKNYFIPLLSGMSTYIPFCNITQTGNISNSFYISAISGKQNNGFYLQTSENLDQNINLNVAVFNTGEFNFDNSIITVGSGYFSGYSIKDLSIKYPKQLNYYPKTLFSIENINHDDLYLAYGKNIGRTGLEIKLSNDLNSGHQININYICFSNTGSGTFHLIENQLVDKDLSLTGAIHIDLLNNFNYGELKVFANIYNLNDNLYIHNIKNKTKNSFAFTLSDNVDVSDLTGLVCDYIVSDMDKDLNMPLDILGRFNYSRLAAFGFNDVGSSIIVGGTGNYIKGLVSVINGGVLNKIVGDFNIIPGGRFNQIIDLSDTQDEYPKSAFSTILGGSNNLVTGNLQYVNIVGGSGNSISNTNIFENQGYSSILGGASNEISGIFSTILGGENNTISGSFSHVVGRNIHISKAGTVVFSDSSTGEKYIDKSNIMLLNFSGGIYITGIANSTSPIVLEYSKIPTSTAGLPQGAIYRDTNNFLKIVP